MGEEELEGVFVMGRGKSNSAYPLLWLRYVVLVVVACMGGVTIVTGWVMGNPWLFIAGILVIWMTKKAL
jgi:hypothetical protein